MYTYHKFQKICPQVFTHEKWKHMRTQRLVHECAQQTSLGNTQMCKEPKQPSTDEWTKALWYIQFNWIYQLNLQLTVWISKLYWIHQYYSIINRRNYRHFTMYKSQKLKKGIKCRQIRVHTIWFMYITLQKAPISADRAWECKRGGSPLPRCPKKLWRVMDIFISLILVIVPQVYTSQNSSRGII